MTVSLAGLYPVLSFLIVSKLSELPNEHPMGMLGHESRASFKNLRLNKSDTRQPIQLIVRHQKRKSVAAGGHLLKVLDMHRGESQQSRAQFIQVGPLVTLSNNNPGDQAATVRRGKSPWKLIVYPERGQLAIASLRPENGIFVPCGESLNSRQAATMIRTLNGIL